MARNQAQNELLRDTRRDQILSAALHLFAAKGLAATKIVDIAAQAQMSLGLLYHYFESKEEIFTELIKTATQRRNEASLWLEAQPISAGEKVRMAIERLIKNIEDNRDAARYFLLMTQAAASDAIPDEAKHVLKEQNDIPYQVLERIFKQGQKDGSVKNLNAKSLAVVFWTSINGLAIYKAVRGGKFKKSEVEILTGMFLHGS